MKFSLMILLLVVVVAISVGAEWAFQSRAAAAEADLPQADVSEDELASASVRSEWRQEEFIISSFHPLTGGALDRHFVMMHKDAGFNLLEMTFVTRDASKRALQFADELGMNVLVGEVSDSVPRFGGFQNVILGTGTEEDIRQTIDYYGDHESLYGYYVWDEPEPVNIKSAAEQVDIFRRYAPDKLAFTVAFPSYWGGFADGDAYLSYLDDYAQTIDLQVMSFDHYPFYNEIRRGIRLEQSTVWRDMGYVRLKALELDVPFWMYVQAVDDVAINNLGNMTIEKIRLQVYYALAYGAKGISYYNTLHSVIDEYGRPTVLFEPMKALHADVINLGSKLMELTSTAVYHTGNIRAPFTDRIQTFSLLEEVPEGLIIGRFEDETGATYILPVNRSYTTPFSDSILFSEPVRVLEISKETGEEVLIEADTTVLSLELEIGEGALYRIESITE